MEHVSSVSETLILSLLPKVTADFLIWKYTYLSDFFFQPEL